ncbi:MAG: 30S ribosomal protein S11 [Candidatus Levybacteria bacterium GW2011_GWA2_37_36]|nr:MAG: 30S ribosomal protein S11 [Candidatus Levybacteria bacterium GW2011_GWA2_37_36]
MAEKKQDSQVEVKKVSTKGGLSSGRKKANVIVTSTGRAYITSTLETVVKKAVGKGLKTVEVYVKGPGAGRDSALRAIKSAGLSISLIADITPVPHNGPRAKKKRRI